MRHHINFRRAAIAALIAAILPWSSALAGSEAKYAGTAANVTLSGSSASWTNTSNALSVNSSSASVSLSGNGNYSDYLQLTNFGFSLTGATTITGIQVAVTRNSGSGKVVDYSIKLVKAGSVTGSSLTSSTKWPSSSRTAYYGGPTNLWGTTWTVSDITSSNFGIALAAKCQGASSNPLVDAIQITVFYDLIPYYDKNNTTNLNATSAWTTSSNGSGGTSPSNFTTDNQIFIIKNNSVPTINGNWTISGANASLQIGDGTATVNFTIPSGNTYTGSVDVQANGTLTLTNATIPTIGILYSGSTVNYNAAGAQTITSTTYDAVQFNGSGTKTLGGTITAEGAVTIGSGVTLADGGYTFNIHDAFTLTGSHTSSGSGKLAFNDVSAQTIAGSGTTIGNLEINNSAGVTLSTAKTINGTLTLSSGAFNNSSATLTIANAASIAANGGTLSAVPTFGGVMDLSYGGSSALTTGYELPTGSTVLRNLTMNSSADVTLGNSCTVNGTLTLTNGHLLLDAYNLTMASGAAFSGGSSASYIRIRSTGKLLMPVGSSSKTLPVGWNPYLPVTITSPDASVTFTVGVSDGVTGNTGASKTTNCVGKTWDITPSATATNVTITFQWENIAELTGFDRTQCLISYRTSTPTGTWTNLTTAAAAGNPSTNNYNLSVTLSTLTMLTGTTYYFAISDNIQPLPVELTDFDASWTGRAVYLTWNTLSEVNNKGFAIERSADGKSWTQFAWVEGHGTTQEVHSYSKYDEGSFSSTIMYYRLVQTDYDGRSDVSEARIVRTGAISSVSLNAFPNPTKNTINVQIDRDFTSPVTLILYDFSGRQLASGVYDLRAAGSLYQLDLNGVASGRYILKVKSAGANKSLLVDKF